MYREIYMHRRLYTLDFARVCVCIVFIFTEQIWLQHIFFTFFIHFFHVHIARFFTQSNADWPIEGSWIWIPFALRLLAAFWVSKCVITPFSLLVRFSLHAHLSNYLFSIRFDRSVDLLTRCTRVHWVETVADWALQSIYWLFRWGVFFKCKYAKLTGFHRHTNPSSSTLHQCDRGVQRRWPNIDSLGLCYYRSYFIHIRYLLSLHMVFKGYNYHTVVIIVIFPIIYKPW